MIILYLLILGIIIGTADVLPMVKMKLDKYSVASAFVFHLTAPFILYYLNIKIAF